LIILPAIDIKDGQCVRLFQGDYAQMATYDVDPVRVAQRWQAAGASWLHIVDLDGAARGIPVNLPLIQNIRDATSLHIEVGGGMRSLEHIERVLATGVDRVILGTIAITNRDLLEEALRRWGESIFVGIDARDGLVAISGWRETSTVKATTLVIELRTIGVQHFVYTDIARDGTLQGPNVAALQEMQKAIHAPPFSENYTSYSHKTTNTVTNCSLIASGGISTLEDLRNVAALGVEGVIVGKALYTGDVELEVAIRDLLDQDIPCGYPGDK
jgi:phosphoribosylformimino-5-aminoimidazole carboxamide ribotide isomerase